MEFRGTKGKRKYREVRDIFLFSCYTGFAYADVQKLKSSEVAKGVDGQQWIFTSRQKTETSSRIPVLPIAQFILNKYEDYPECVHKGKVLPDAMGNRVEKQTIVSGNTNTTYYVRGSNGNIMTIYSDSTLLEQQISGTGRIGCYTGGNLEGYLTLGNKKYELSNHLGNILAVTSDNIGMLGDSTWANVLSSSDYYLFGLGMKGRTWHDSTFRYGFNGKEKDNSGNASSVNYDYGFRIYNPSIGRFLSTDPLSATFPFYSPYQFAGNKPVWAIDLDGLEEKKATSWEALTYPKLKQIATSHDVWRQVQTKFPTLTPDKQYEQFKFRLGRIFEGAVLQSVDREKNTKRFYADPLDPSRYVIPDAVIGSATAEQKMNKEGENVVHYFWWNEGAFIDAKTSETKQISDSKQLRSFVDILASK